MTGIGIVTPIGIEKEAFWAGICSGRSPIRRLTRFEPEGLRCRIAAEIDGFDPRDFIEPRRLKRLDRYAQFSIAAAKLALQDGGLDNPGASMGVCMGTALGGIAFAEEQHTKFLQNGIRAVNPTLAILVFNGSSSSHTALELKLSGPNLTVSNSCASGTMAIGEAYRWIREGRADRVLAGGAEAPLAPLTFGSFDLIRAMSTHNDEPERACRPFDRDRDGFVMGEGACVLLVEELEVARDREASIYGEVSGYGLTNDAYHMTAPLPDGLQAAEAIRLALADAGIQGSEIGYINAHASSTPLNDRTETLAIHTALGDGVATRIPVSGTKALTGHSLGATGAIEAAIGLLAIEREHLPANVNLEQPEDGCDLNYIMETGRSCRVDHVLSNSFGFGGINATLILSRLKEDR